MSTVDIFRYYRQDGIYNVGEVDLCEKNGVLLADLKSRKIDICKPAADQNGSGSLLIADLLP